MWAELVDAERTQRGALLVGSASSPKPTKQARAWWSAVEALLRSYELGVAAGQDVEPLPWDFVAALSGLAGFLAAGRIPDPIQHVAGRGNSSAGPKESRDIALAVAYRCACREEGFSFLGTCIRIDDKRPVASLVKWFGVNRKTVQGWMRHRAPSLYSVTPVDAELLANLTQRAGRRYQSAGRSQPAILGRDRQRRHRK